MPRKPSKMGRPVRAGQVASERIELRVTRLERLTWERAAEAAGMNLSEWIRRRVFIEPEPTTMVSLDRERKP